MMSAIMIGLYGQDNAKLVYERCERLSVEFNKLVQRIVYDTFWADTGLSIVDKSMITIVSLALLNKSEQLHIHLIGFTNLKHPPEKLKALFSYLETHFPCDAIQAAKGTAASSMKDASKGVLMGREVDLISLAAHVALGNQEKTSRFLASGILTRLSREAVEKVMLHQMMYCGFPCAMNGFAVLPKVQEKTTAIIPRSTMMDALYGVKAQAVYERCEALSHRFNELVQNVVYTEFWAREGLVLHEKSLITIVALILQNKVEQTEIHLCGYLNLEKTLADSVALFDELDKLGYSKAATAARAILTKVAPESATVHSSHEPSSREQALIELASVIAIGAQEKTTQFFEKISDNLYLSELDVENVLLHLIIYCGFPSVMNGFMARG